MMFRRNFISVFFMLGMFVCNTASSALVSYNFSQSGFDNGGVITGKFEGDDLDGNGVLTGGSNLTNLTSPAVPFSSELTAFSMSFSGNNTLPAFTLSLADVQLFLFDLTGDDLLGNNIPSLIDAEAIIAFNDSIERGYLIGPDFSFNEECGIRVSCSLVNAPSFLSSPIKSFELITVSSIPLPATVWLFGSGLLGLFGMRQTKAPTKSV